MKSKLLEQFLKGMVLVGRDSSVRVVLGVNWKTYGLNTSLVGWLSFDGTFKPVNN